MSSHSGDQEKQPLVPKTDHHYHSVDPEDGFVAEKASTMDTLVNFAKSSIGAGSFALPWAMLQAGVVLGSVGLTLISWVSLYTMNVMLECKNMLGVDDNGVKS